MEKQIILKKNEEKRLLKGHQWIFSNEIAEIQGMPEAGDVVELLRYDGASLGIGFYHPHSLIAFRFLSKNTEPIDTLFFSQRIEQALQVRNQLYPHSTTYRLIHGESDFLPGLIIDRYNEYFSLQVFSTGMERSLSFICDALEEHFHPKAIVARNTLSLRSLEQLPLHDTVLRGTPGETIYTEGEVQFVVDVLKGQKTGIFLDQRENRLAFRRYVNGKTVLDCFCNDGGFALHAAKAGAHQVIGIDISETTIERATINARLNKVTNCSFIVADVFEYLKQQREAKNSFDAIILDPPSFTKSKKNISTALHGYKQLHTLALQLFKKGGILATASCSHHITMEAFFETIHAAALKTQRSVQLLETHGAAPDHPVLLSMPETQYLKFAIFAVQ